MNPVLFQKAKQVLLGNNVNIIVELQPTTALPHTIYERENMQGWVVGSELYLVFDHKTLHVESLTLKYETFPYL